MKKLTNEERIGLIHALMAASNAFHKTLKEYGYGVSFGLDGTKIGSLYKTSELQYERSYLGEVTIQWKIEDRFRNRVRE